MSAVGAPPTARLATARFRRGSMRETVPAYRLATHTEPAPAASAAGPLPTGTVAVTARAAGSTRDTVASRLLATQSEPACAASATGPLPTCTRPVARPEAGSILLDRPAVVPRHPQRPVHRRERARLQVQRQRAAQRSGRGVDLEQLAGDRVGHPQPAGAVRDRARVRPRERDRLRHGLGGRVDPGDGGAHGARHPDRPGAAGDAPGAAADQDPVDLGTGTRVDPRDLPAAGIGHPDRAAAAADRAGRPGELGRVHELVRGGVRRRPGRSRPPGWPGPRPGRGSR